MNRLPLILLMMLVLVVAPAARAEDAPAENDQTHRPAVTEQQVRKWIEELDSDSFAEREAATIELSTAGVAAVQPIVDAAQSTSLEVQVRAFVVLKHFYRAEDEQVRDACVKALQALSDSENSSIAEQAKEILAVPHYEVPAGNWLGVTMVRGIGANSPIQLHQGGGISIGGGRVRLGYGSQIVVSGVVDGTRIVDIIQGSGLGVMILDSEKGNGIVVHTCETPEDGEPKFNRYIAKDADELAKKHPKIHAFYDKFKGYRGGTVMNGAVVIK
jgi:hypothetical protein